MHNAYSFLTCVTRFNKIYVLVITERYLLLFVYAFELQWLEHILDHRTCSRHGYFEPLRIDHSPRTDGKWW